VNHGAGGFVAANGLLDAWIETIDTSERPPHDDRLVGARLCHTASNCAMSNKEFGSLIHPCREQVGLMRAILADACFPGARRLPRRQIVSSQRHGYPTACTLRSRRSTTARVRLACELLRAVVRDLAQVGADGGRGYGRGAGFGFGGGWVTWRDGPDGGGGGDGV